MVTRLCINHLRSARARRGPTTVTSVVNPDKLRHLGPLADLGPLSGHGHRGRQEPLPGTSRRHHTGG